MDLSEMDLPPIDVEIIRRVEIAHVNYETTAVFIEDTQITFSENSLNENQKEEIRKKASNDMKPLDLMILLRS